MFDIGWAELFVIAVVALLAVGPEKLPEVARGLARVLRQMRRIVGEFRDAVNLEEFDAQIRQSSQVGTGPSSATERGVPLDSSANLQAATNGEGAEAHPVVGAVKEGAVVPAAGEVPVAMGVSDFHDPAADHQPFADHPPSPDHQSSPDHQPSADHGPLR